jgi:alkylated DNA repair protein alkB homolog 6
MNIEQYKLEGPLSSIYYIPEFVTSAQESTLLDHIHSCKHWIQLSGRKSCYHGGVITKKGVLIMSDIPHWLSLVTTAISSLTDAGCPLFGCGETANHVLINAYQPGEGIMPHQDGPLYYPVVAILSLSSPAILQFHSRAVDTSDQASLPKPSLLASVLLQPRSMLVFKDAAYTQCNHGIDEVYTDIVDESVMNKTSDDTVCKLVRREQRISLTCRRVLKSLNYNR